MSPPLIPPRNGKIATSTNFLRLLIRNRRKGEKFWGWEIDSITSKNAKVDIWHNRIEETEQFYEEYQISDKFFICILLKKKITHIRAMCWKIGLEKLGIKPDKVGRHFIRTDFPMQPHLVGNIDFRIMMTDHWKSLAFALVCLALNSTFRKISTYVIVSHITFQCKLQSKEPNTKRHFPADIDLNLHWLQHLTSSMVPSIHSSLCVTNFII